MNAFVRTSDGFIWLSTQEGVARFDGLQFQVHNAHTGFPCAWAGPLLAGDDNGLWVGTNDCGLVRYHPDGRVENYPLRPKLSQDRVSALAREAGERVWVGTEHGLAHFQDGRVTWVPALEETSVTSLALGADGTLWVGGRGRIFALQAGQVVHTYGSAQGVPADDVTELHVDARER